MKYKYYCYSCGNEETVKYAQGQLKCPVCGKVMVYQGTEEEDE